MKKTSKTSVYLKELLFVYIIVDLISPKKKQTFIPHMLLIFLNRHLIDFNGFFAVTLIFMQQVELRVSALHPLRIFWDHFWLGFLDKDYLGTLIYHFLLHGPCFHLYSRIAFRNSLIEVSVPSGYHLSIIFYDSEWLVLNHFSCFSQICNKLL